MGCLSRMRGNSHVRFLGEGVAARLPPYPPRAVGSIPIARSTSLHLSLICSYSKVVGICFRMSFPAQQIAGRLALSAHCRPPCLQRTA